MLATEPVAEATTGALWLLLAPPTRLIPGPPTVKIRCHWLPGASGGGWLIENGTMIDGLTSYGRNHDLVHTFGPYFSSENVGKLVAGF